jgi:hypothetical protein
MMLLLMMLWMLMSHSCTATLAQLSLLSLSNCAPWPQTFALGNLLPTL